MPQSPVQNQIATRQQSYLWWFALLSALMAAVVWNEHLRQPAQEFVTYPTALADQHYLAAQYATPGGEFTAILGAVSPSSAGAQRWLVDEILSQEQSPAPQSLEKCGFEANHRFSLYRPATGTPAKTYVLVAPQRFATVVLKPTSTS